MKHERDPLTIEHTSVRDIDNALYIVSTISLECNICEDETVITDHEGRDTEYHAEKLYREGWRRVTWPSHIGLACPGCVKRGFIDYNYCGLADYENCDEVD